MRGKEFEGYVRRSFPDHEMHGDERFEDDGPC